MWRLKAVIHAKYHALWAFPGVCSLDHTTTTTTTATTTTATTTTTLTTTTSAGTKRGLWRQEVTSQAQVHKTLHWPCMAGELFDIRQIWRGPKVTSTMGCRGIACDVNKLEVT